MFDPNQIQAGGMGDMQAPQAPMPQDLSQSGPLAMLQVGTGNPPTQGQEPPPPQNNAQNAGPVKSGLRHVLAQMIGNFSYGAGQSMIKASGGETDAERSMRIATLAHLNAQTQMVQTQQQKLKTSVPYTDAAGNTFQLPAAIWEKLQQQIIKNQGSAAVAGINKRFFNVPGVGLYDTHTPDESGNPTKIPDSGQGITITPEIAQQYSLPKEYIGKPMKLTDLSSMLRGQSFQNQVVQGAGGPVTVNKQSGEAKPVTINGQRVGNPQVEARQAGAFFAAKYGLVQSVDEAGNPVFMSRLGAAGAPTNTGALQIMKGRAGLDNYRDALNRVNENMDVLNDTGQRALLAQSLRNIGTIHDPGIISATIGNAVSQGMSPRTADLAAAMLQAREFIGSNRQFAGNFQGSEALYQRMIANVPGPMNSVELNKALITQDLANTSRIEQRINKFQGSGSAKPKAAASASGGGFFEKFGGAKQ